MSLPTEQVDSAFVRHVPCDTCQSNDNGSLYSDGHTYCHVCGTYTHASGEGGQRLEIKRAAGLLSGLQFSEIEKRRLTEETCVKWGYGWTQHNGEVVQVAEYRDVDGNVVGQKIRTANKEFSWRGDKPTTLYGRHLWRDAGKMLVITEGEIDAMSVSQVQSHKWPVVSIPSGAQSAAKVIAHNVEWLEKFDKVIFMFDMDEPGRAAASECAMVLSPGKAYVASLPLKDANELLKANRGSEIIDAIWAAKQFRPDGVVAGADLWERLKNVEHIDSLPYPWSGLQAKTRGCRVGEVVCVTAGTGIGKSEVVRQIVSHFHDHHNETVGYIALEESIERTAFGFMGLHLGTRMFIDPGAVPLPEREAAFKATIGSGRYFLYDHFGSLEGDHLLSRIRFMVRGCGCKTVVLDHLSIVVSGSASDDERKTIDMLMTKLRSMVQELKFRLIIINHLRRDDKASHEEGARPRLNHLRGSGSIAQLSDMVIALVRDQQDKENPNVTGVVVLKNRHTGETGDAGFVKYDVATGRLSEVSDFTPADEKQDNPQSAF